MISDSPGVHGAGTPIYLLAGSTGKGECSRSGCARGEMLPNPIAVALCLIPCMSLRIRLYSIVSWLIILLPNTLMLRASSLLGRLSPFAKAWITKLCVAPGFSITSGQLSVRSNGAHAATEYTAKRLRTLVPTDLPLMLLLASTLMDLNLQYWDLHLWLLWCSLPQTVTLSSFVNKPCAVCNSAHTCASSWCKNNSSCPFQWSARSPRATPLWTRLCSQLTWNPQKRWWTCDLSGLRDTWCPLTSWCCKAMGYSSGTLFSNPCRLFFYNHCDQGPSGRHTHSIDIP